MTQIELKIEKLGPQDLPRVMKIEEKSFSTPWTAYHFIVDLVAPGGYYLSAKLAGQVVGYTGMRQVLDEGHVTTLAVQPEHRGKGIARKLIEALLEGGKERGVKVFLLEVRESNLAAQKIYEKFGFKASGKRKGYYSGPDEDAILMERKDVES